MGIYGYFLPEKYSFLAIDALCYCLYLCPKILGNSINIKMNQIKSLYIRLTGIIVFIFFFHSLFAQQDRQSVIRGSVKDSKGDPVEFATVYIKETQQGTQSDIKGDFLLQVAPGSYTFCVQMMGYETHEQPITVQPGGRMTISVELA